MKAILLYSVKENFEVKRAWSYIPFLVDEIWMLCINRLDIFRDTLMRELDVFIKQDCKCI